MPNKTIQILLFFIGLLYYLFFVNKGLILFDEGYFVHSAERIYYGNIPYKDFTLQYSPLYFYILAFLYKIFGPSILVGRFLSLTLCLLIIPLVFLLINKLKINSRIVIILSFLSIIAYGYPLINIPNIIWANVLVATISILVYLHWYSINNKRQQLFLVALGLTLALSLALKQNIGVIYIFLFNILVLFSKENSFSKKIKNIFILNGIWIFYTFVWVYYFFLKDNFIGLLDFINFSKRFSSSMAFSYPPLTNILNSFGFFKLLPYYLPIIFTIVLFFYTFKKNKDWKIFGVCIVPVIGFITTIFPQSDLLHVYPFFGLILVALLVFFQKFKIYPLVLCTIGLLIVIGFYLTFFGRAYRYDRYYFEDTTSLSLQRTNGIFIEKNDAKKYLSLSKFINTHTEKTDYIFVYPYSPMLYFILERKNPTRDPIYFLPNWHFDDNKKIINDIKQKHVKYIITIGSYKNNTKLSLFIQKHQKVFQTENLVIYEIINKKT